MVGYVPSVTLTAADFPDPRRISMHAAQLRKLHRAPRFANDLDMVAVQLRYLMPGNFLECDGPGSHIWVVDYEYSGNKDPCYDLGDAINELELDAGQAEALVTEYHGGTRPQQLARARL